MTRHGLVGIHGKLSNRDNESDARTRRRGDDSEVESVDAEAGLNQPRGVYAKNERNQRGRRALRSPKERKEDKGRMIKTKQKRGELHS